MQVHRENELDVINAVKQMHYSRDTGYGRALYPQTHDFYELLLVLSGRQELEIGGCRSVVGEGSLTLIRPGEVHSRRYLCRGQHINVAFSAQVAREMFHYLGDGFPAAQLLSAAAPVSALLSRAQTEYYRRRFDQINLIPLEQAARSRTTLRVLLAGMFTREFAFLDAAGLSLATDWFSHLVESMKSPEMWLGGVEAMVNLSGRSHEHLCRVFRARMGMTPTEFVNDLRVSHAARLLLASSDPIVDVCYSAGFENMSHFYHLFRHKYGRSPGRFRAEGQYPPGEQYRERSQRNINRGGIKP